eukprot:14399261-Ditylum_brightwellii.AAC.1
MAFHVPTTFYSKRTLSTTTGHFSYDPNGNNWGGESFSGSENEKDEWQSSYTSSSSTGEWSVSDDWSTLSSTSPKIDSDLLYNSDIVSVAARAMEQQQQQQETVEVAAGEEDVELQETVDYIYHNTHEPNDPALYDTPASLNTVDFLDEAGKEVSLLVRCNEYPEELLIQEGRALAPLTEDEKYNVSQLIKVLDEEDETKKRFETTPFFEKAVSKLFAEHAVSVPNTEKHEKVLDRAAIARWMSKSLSNESDVVVQHDKRVTTVISQYGTYGTGYLTKSEFRQLYMDAVLTGWNESNVGTKRAGWKMTNYNEERMKQLKLKTPTVRGVWRDFYNHGIIAPVEEERVRLQGEIDEEFGGGGGGGASSSSSSSKLNIQKSNTLMDECEILEWGDHDHIDPRSNDDDTNQNEGGSDGKKKRGKKSSWEFVELASDNKTPKRIRDGKF